MRLFISMGYLAVVKSTESASHRMSQYIVFSTTRDFRLEVIYALIFKKNETVDSCVDSSVSSKSPAAERHQVNHKYGPEIHSRLVST